MRVNFDYEKGVWFVEAPIALDRIMRARVVNFVRPELIKRIQGEIGDRKRRMKDALDKLSPQTLEVRMIGKGEKTLYLEPGTKL